MVATPVPAFSTACSKEPPVAGSKPLSAAFVPGPEADSDAKFAAESARVSNFGSLLSEAVAAVESAGVTLFSGMVFSRRSFSGRAGRTAVVAGSPAPVGEPPSEIWTSDFRESPFPLAPGPICWVVETGLPTVWPSSSEIFSTVPVFPAFNEFPKAAENEPGKNCGNDRKTGKVSGGVAGTVGGFASVEVFPSVTVARFFIASTFSSATLS